MNEENNVLHYNFLSEYPIITKSKGIHLFDDKGKKYIDAMSSNGVVSLGHGQEEIINAIMKTAKQLTFAYGGNNDHPPRIALARKLNEWAPEKMKETKTFFCLGGSEANEAAIKNTYRYHFEQGKPEKTVFISRWQSYHGNTLATLSLSGRTQWRRVYNSLLIKFPHISPPYCYRCQQNKEYPKCGMACAHELEHVITQYGAENVAGFIAEPIIGTSISAVVPPPEYYPTIRKICDKYDVLFIADEVKSGIGRTGKKWGIDHWDVSPDIITTSKGIASGYLPLAATILSEKVWQVYKNKSGKVMHGFTFSGHPLTVSAGLATLEFIEKNDLLSHIEKMGKYFMNRLKEEFQDHPHVGDVRGIGLYIGVEFVKDKETKEIFPIEWNVAHKIVKTAFKNGLIIGNGMTGIVNGEGGDHIELSPPFIITEDQIDSIIEIFRESIQEVMNKLPM